MDLPDDEKEYLVRMISLDAEVMSDVPLPIPTQHWLLNVQQPWAYLLVSPDLQLQLTTLGGGAYFLEAYDPEAGPQGQKGTGLVQGGE